MPFFAYGCACDAINGIAGGTTLARPRWRHRVGDAHLGFFDSPDAIADAKAEILEAATPRTVLVANADDDRIAARISGSRLVDRETRVCMIEIDCWCERGELNPHGLSATGS